MTLVNAVAKSVAKAATRIGGALTSEPVTPKLGKNACPYLGHVPYFGARTRVSEVRANL